MENRVDDTVFITPEDSFSGGMIRITTKSGWCVEVIIPCLDKDTAVYASEEVCNDLGIPFNEVDWPLI